jgi:hypothetical protein
MQNALTDAKIFPKLNSIEFTNLAFSFNDRDSLL